MSKGCPDVEDCLDDPEEIIAVCPYDAICGKCAYWIVVNEQDELLMGRCKKKPTSGLINCKGEICNKYIIRTEYKDENRDLEVLDMDREELKELFKEILDETIGISDVEMANKWDGGELIIRPGNQDMQEKVIPIDSFFHKIVMVRDRVRVMEQKINAHSGLSDEDKVEMQQYITRIYGSLTTFNILFADKADQFSGDRGK